MKRLMCLFVLLLFAVPAYADDFVLNLTATVNNETFRILTEGLDRTYTVTNETVQYNETFSITRAFSQDNISSACNSLSTNCQNLNDKLSKMYSDSFSYYGLYVNATNDLGRCEVNLTNTAIKADSYNNCTVQLDLTEKQKADCEVQKNNYQNQLSACESNLAIKSSRVTELENSKLLWGVGGLIIGALGAWFGFNKIKPRNPREEISEERFR